MVSVRKSWPALFLFVGIALVLLLSTALATRLAEAAEATSEQGLLVVVRPLASPPLAYKPMLTINAVNAFALPHGYHALVRVAPGEYQLTADWQGRGQVGNSSLSVTVQANTTTYVLLNNAAVTPNSSSGPTITSELQITEQVKLTDSHKITRFDRQWLSTHQRGRLPAETLNERYGLSLNHETLLNDFTRGSDNKKMEVARYLINLGYYDESLLVEFERELLAQYHRIYGSKQEAQPLAYICKYVAASRWPEFTATLTEVRRNAGDAYIRKYAARYLDTYYGL
ncbi:hypothetical protein [Halioxenophilus sp. WMMB6]|uniref:hypothetical protein n=1 Tax=Halioxenophilus sp. WMMB6 TaxID=3073815 RepID=UPI00295F4CF8|nr:hypothetical protein [Halioxenophilus sp. WMMB6]